MRIASMFAVPSLLLLAAGCSTPYYDTSTSRSYPYSGSVLTGPPADASRPCDNRADSQKPASPLSRRGPTRGQTLPRSGRPAKNVGRPVIHYAAPHPYGGGMDTGGSAGHWQHRHAPPILHRAVITPHCPPMPTAGSDQRLDRTSG